MVVHLNFPNCWDGVNEDSLPDHRSHVSYGTVNGCPPGWQIIPDLGVVVHDNSVTNGTGTFLASHVYAHGDFINVWDQPVLEDLVDACLNANVVCTV